MAENKLMIAAAGAGKTTFLVKEALKLHERVLITTFTDENESVIRQKFVDEHGCVPQHVTILTWFSFLLKHGVKPFQGTTNPILFDMKIIGVELVNEQSGIKYTMKRNGKDIPILYKEEEDFCKAYFTKDHRIYTDKIAKFVIRANEKSDGRVIKRISTIFPYIFIDEVQDLAGYDLEIIKLLYHCDSIIVCVGDPRQTTYHTHWEKKNKKYRKGDIESFVKDCCYKKDKVIIDKDTLCSSHRNNKEICEFSARVYPQYPIPVPCNCPDCHKKDINHQGVFIISFCDVKDYLQQYHPVQLRYSKDTEVDYLYPSINFGISKGKTYDRVLIYPTQDMKDWLKNNNKKLSDETRAKLYVAITRARYSVAFVINPEAIECVSYIPTWNSSQ